MSNDTADAANTRYSASWTKPGNSLHQFYVSANESGVSFSEKWGPTPYDEFGKGYTWEEWYKHGTTGSDGPNDMLARINAVGRALGHEPVAPTTVRRDSLEITESEASREHARYLADLRLKAKHSSP